VCYNAIARNILFNSIVFTVRSKDKVKDKIKTLGAFSPQAPDERTRARPRTQTRASREFVKGKTLKSLDTKKRGAFSETATRFQVKFSKVLPLPLGLALWWLKAPRFMCIEMYGG
jgi:hypothetical protein